jgi:choline monooxygenase
VRLSTKLSKKHYFPKIRCAASVASDLPNPGDMLPVDIAGWPVLLLRNDEGELKAFHNICRHRAMALVTEPCNKKAIVCPWHAWRYGLDGSLLRTPRVGGDATHSQDGLNRDTLGLMPIRLARWHDMT